MAGPQKDYRRLSSHPFFSLSTARSALWIADDHLLKITTTGYTEDYKRFYFKDIQAIVLSKTLGDQSRTMICVSAMAICFLIGIGIGGPWALSIAALGDLFFLILLLINLRLGPTCACHVRTAVQTERVRIGGGRLRHTRQALAMLRPLILEAQGGPLMDEELEALAAAPSEPAPAESAPAEVAEIHADETAQEPAAPAPAPLSSPALPPAIPIKTPFVLPVLILLAVDGCLAALDLVQHRAAIIVVASMNTAILTILAIMAIIRLPSRGVAQGLRNVLWGVLGYIILSFFAGYLLMISIIMKNPSVPQNQWSIIQAIASQPVKDSPLLMGFDYASMAITWLLALLGFIHWLRLRRIGRVHEPAPAPGPEAPARQET